MARRTEHRKEPADNLEAQLQQVGIRGGKDGDEYRSILSALDGLQVGVDTFGRAAIVVAKLRQNGYRISPPSVCEDCGQSLIVNRGSPGRIAAHFRHPGGKACPGGMSPWHAAMQRAAVSLGFVAEFLCGAGAARGRRLDAFHAGKGLCLEFVNSNSLEYKRKNTELSVEISNLRGVVRGVAWVFNSGARFATRAHEETVDVAALRKGFLRVGNLFRDDRGVRETIRDLGEANCFTIYRGAMFGCIGCDFWECLPEGHCLQWLCQHERGFNFSLFRQGKDGIGHVVRPRYPLPAGRVDLAGLAGDIAEEVRTGKLSVASALQYGTGTAVAGSNHGEVSEKMPSDNDAAGCDSSDAAKASRNLSAGQVKTLIESARAEYDGCDIPSWNNDRKCGQTPEVVLPAPASKAALTTVTVNPKRPGIDVSAERFPRLPAGLSGDRLELFNERAAIMEFDGGLSSGEAATRAYLEVLKYV
jgi:hypothetical protein